MTTERTPGEGRGITDIRSVVGAIAPYLDAVTHIAPSKTPDWLRRLPIPDGWRRARMEGDALQPTRTAVCGERQGGGWDGCDTLSLYSFSGSAPREVIWHANRWTLDDLSAESVTTCPLDGPADEGIVLVRSCGYLTVMDRRLWAQYSTFVAPHCGVLLLHNIFVGTEVRTRLRGDIADLSDGVHAGFLRQIDSVDDDPPTTPLPEIEGDQDGP